MGLDDLNQKFTLDRYCTSFEVAQALHTNLIDQIWKNISEFRRTFYYPLELRDINNSRFYITYIDTVHNRIRDINEQISNYKNNFLQLQNGSLQMSNVTSDMLKSSLKSIAYINNIQITDFTLGKIIEHKVFDPEFGPIINYYNALEKLFLNPKQNIDEDFLGNFLSIIRNEELSSFYRTNDNVTAASKALVEREYDNGVPSRYIENMMANTLAFVSNPENSVISKIVACFYMFNYIKPFEDHNIEMACLLAKCVLANQDLNEAAVFVPIENFLTDKQFFGDVFREVRKSYDFTYAFLKGSDILARSFSTVIDKIVQVTGRALHIVATMGDDPEQAKKEFGINLEDYLGKKQVKPVTPKPVAPVQKPVEASTTTIKIVGTTQISKEELKRMENDMLESNPNIKKGQAHFYVRHCTKGKYYTIQQYKAEEKCVYETARTSMDNLALQGYYRKEQFKNKFVYTPIDKE